MSTGKSAISRPKLKTQMDFEDVADFNSMHKQAFRVAFDFCGKVFPPTNSHEYWKATLELISKTVEDNKENILIPPLLMGVYSYLEDLVKDLPTEEST